MPSVVQAVPVRPGPLEPASWGMREPTLGQHLQAMARISLKCGRGMGS